VRLPSILVGTTVLSATDQFTVYLDQITWSDIVEKYAVVVAERENVSFVTNASGVLTADEQLKTKAVQDAHRQHLKIPRRCPICFAAIF